MMYDGQVIAALHSSKLPNCPRNGMMLTLGKRRPHVNMQTNIVWMYTEHTVT